MSVSHEVLQRKIERLTGVESTNQDPREDLISFTLSGAAQRLVLNGSVYLSAIQVGVGGHTSAGNRLNKDNRTYWVTDRSVVPPITRFLMSSLLGDFAGTSEGEPVNNYGNDTTDVQQLHGVLSEEGLRIVDEMHGLVDRFDAEVANLTAAN